MYTVDFLIFSSTRCWWYAVDFLMLKRCWWYAVDFLMLKHCWWYAVDFPMFMLTRCWCYTVDFLVCMLTGSWLHWCVARTPLDAIHAKKNQVFAAATLPRKPGLQQILASIRLYRKECAAGLVRVSPSHAVKAACLQSLQWDDEIVSCMCSCGTRFWKQMQGWRLKNQQKPSVFSLFGATARHRVCAYVYIYIYVVAVFFHQLDQGFLFLKMFEKTSKFFDYIDTKGS